MFRQLQQLYGIEGERHREIEILTKGHFYVSFFNLCLFEKRGMCYTENWKFMKWSGDAMSEENTEAVTHRRKRVQRLKRYIIRMVLFLIF